MPRLTDPWFDAQFYGEINDADRSHRYLPSIEGAQGLFLWCPCGYGKAEFPLDGGRPHGVMVPFSNPRNAPLCPPDHGPHSARDPSAPHPRWVMTGTSLEDLSTQPSIQVGSASDNTACWHGYITNGEVT
jgi:hypothetical protein